MHKWEALSRITQAGLVAVVRATSADVADRIARACMEGGVGAIEITFTVPGAQPSTAAVSSIPVYPNRDSVRAVTDSGSPSNHRSTSMSWIECSINVPPPVCATSLRHVDPYIP